MRISLIIISLLLSTACFGQVKSPKDTLYYLVDTAKTPIKDRLMKIEIEGPWNCFVIECACLKYNQRPVFIYELKNQNSTRVGIKAFKRIKFITLSKLIELAKDGEGDNFNNKHVAYFVEPDGKKYVMRKVRLLKPIKREVTY